MSAIEVIAPTTSAITAQAMRRVKTVPSTIIADALAGAEEVEVYATIDDGLNWFVYQQEGAPVVLTATSQSFSVQSPITLGFLKDATASACGVYQMDRTHV